MRRLTLASALLACAGACTLLTARENLSDGEGNNGAAGSAADASVQEAGGAAGEQSDTGVIDQPSCKGLPTTCGGDRSCCASVVIEGGTFPMGSDAGDAETPEHAVEVSSFRLDVFEVTVGRFRNFINAVGLAYTPKEGSGSHPKLTGSGWKSDWNDELQEGLKMQLAYPPVMWSQQAEAYEGHPINGIAWYVAFAFCAWDGGRLPTEAEWEYAAAGGYRNLRWPWGDQAPDESRAVYNLACVEAGTCDRSDMVAAGRRPEGGGYFGNMDLAGSMIEWTLDYFASDWYSGQGQGCKDCAKLGETDAGRTLRGGSWWRGTSDLHASFRLGHDPASLDGDVGFRCARSP